MTAPTTDEAYQAYRTAPTPATLHGVVKTLQPTIDYALASVNASDDPLVCSRAHLFAAEAVERYSPEHAGQASLATHVGSHLRQLSRTARQSRSPVMIPERAQLDAYKLSEARKRFEDEHGREPDMTELADATGMPIKRLAKIGQYAMSTPSEEGFGGEIESSTPDYAQDALEAIHQDSDHTDRRIIELKLGFGGHQQMEPQLVAQKLNLTPSQLSRRAMRIAKRMHDYQMALENV